MDRWVARLRAWSGRRRALAVVAAVALVLLPCLACAAGVALVRARAAPSPEVTVRRAYEAANAGRYAEADGYLAPEVVPWVTLGGSRAFWDRQTLGGVLARVETRDARIAGDSATVRARFVYEAGTPREETLALRRVAGRWRLTFSPQAAAAPAPAPAPTPTPRPSQTPTPTPTVTLDPADRTAQQRQVDLVVEGVRAAVAGRPLPPELAPPVQEEIGRLVGGRSPISGWSERLGALTLDPPRWVAQDVAARGEDPRLRATWRAPLRGDGVVEVLPAPAGTAQRRTVVLREDDYLEVRLARRETGWVVVTVGGQLYIPEVL